MALTSVERDTVRRLESRLQRDRSGAAGGYGFLLLDRYYDAEQRIEHLGIAVPEEFRHFLVIAAWPATYVDSICQRQRPLGFRLPGESNADEDLARVWQANDLDDESALGRTDARVFGRSYICVGSSEDDRTPLVTVESPLEMVHEQHPGTRRVLNAARFYVDDSLGTTERRGTLYTPNSRIHVVQGRNGWEEATGDEYERDDHGLGVVPVEPVVNRSRVHKRGGRSDMLKVMGLTDACARALTNAQFATETVAAPSRWAAGMSPDDFKDPVTGEMLPAWEAYLGAIMATSNKDAKFGQFAAADLGNFERIVNLYGQLSAGVTGLPLRYFGQLTTNPPSADGIRADESRLILDVEFKNLSDGASYERMARLIRRFQGLEDDPDLASMETLWQNPATPTVAQTTDAAVKVRQTGDISRRSFLRQLGWTDVQIEQNERELRDEQSDSLIESLTRPVGVGDAGTSGGVGALPGAAGGVS